MKLKYIMLGIVMILLGALLGWVGHAYLSPIADAHQHEMEAATSEDGTIYTCSMHPQIRQPEPGICPICEMDLIPLDNSLQQDDPTVLRMSSEAAKLAQIETVTVGSQNNFSSSMSTIEVKGTVELDERSVRTQTAHLPGRIEKMEITFEGQYVRQGQTVATIYSTELLAATEELITAANYENRVQGILESTKQKLRNWNISEEQINSFIEKGEPTATLTLYADHNGYVLNKIKSQGDYVTQGGALYTLGSTANLWLLFDVFENDLAMVKRGQMVQFTTPAIPNRRFEAKISYIEPLLNPNTRTAVVRAEMSNPNNQLKPGMLLSGKIMSAGLVSNDDALIVPKSSVLWTGEHSVVYRQLSDSDVPTFQFVEVTVGERKGDFIEITSGLLPGDNVVVQGAFAVDAAAQLNNNFSMMNRDVKVKKENLPGVVPDYSDQVSEDFSRYLQDLASQYIQLKNALVQTDLEEATKAAKLFLEYLPKVPATDFDPAASEFWSEKQKALNAHADLMLKASDIEQQRDQFDFLSTAMIESLKAFGTNDQEYFVQYCPMAKDNQGASWISTEETIRNPYFGDKMMKCGVVKIKLGS